MNAFLYLCKDCGKRKPAGDFHPDTARCAKENRCIACWEPLYAAREANWAQQYPHLAALPWPHQAVPARRRVVAGLVEFVAEFWGVSMDDLMGIRRYPYHARARRAVLYLLVDRLKLVYTDAAAVVHGDHTTAIHHCQKARRLLAAGSGDEAYELAQCIREWDARMNQAAQVRRTEQERPAVPQTRQSALRAAYEHRQAYRQVQHGQ